MAEKEAKDIAQMEQQERSEKIQARQATECRYHKVRIIAKFVRIIE